MPLSLLARRITTLHGWQRTGRKISEQVRASLEQVEIHREGEVDFLWSKGSYAERVAFRPELDRTVRDISRSEIAALIDANSEFLKSSEDTCLDLARMAGINRLSADARSYLELCLDWHKKSED